MAKITDLLITELDHEAIGIRKALENVPEGKNDWKPHDKSMPSATWQPLSPPPPAGSTWS